MNSPGKDQTEPDKHLRGPARFLAPGARGWLRYGAAVSLTAAAIVVRLAFLQTLGSRASFVTFVPAVTLAALYGGFRAGLLATMLSALAADYFWIAPRGGFFIQEPADWAGIGIFLASGTLIAGVVEAMHRARAHLHAAEAQARIAAERARAEQVLREGEDRMRFALETIQVGAWDLDLADHSAFRSPAHDRIFGYAELLPRWSYELFLDHVLPEDRATVDAKFRQATATHSDWNLECRIRRADGQVRWIWAAGRHRQDRLGGWQRMAGIVQDITERKQAEEALRTREQHFRTMADAIPQLAWIARADGWLQWYNRRWYEYTGTTPAQMEGWGWQSVQDPAALPKVLEQWKVSIATGEPFDMTLPLRGADGVFRPFLTRVMPLKDEQGHVLQWFGTNTDVSEQQRAEDELKRAHNESEVRVRARTADLHAASRYARNLLEASLDPLVTINPLGKITDVNRATELVTGVTRERLIGSSFSDYFTDPAKAETGYHKVLADGLVRDYPLTIRHTSGRTTDVHYNATVYRNEAGVVKGVFAAARDVTERKRAEAELVRYRDHLEELVRQRTGELEAANAQLRLQLTVLQSTANAIVITGRDGAIQWVNAAFTRLTGYRPEEVVGQNPRVLKSGLHDAAFYQGMWRTILTGRVWHGELVNKRKDASLYPEEMTIAPVTNAAGAITHFVAVKQDITERRDAEEALRQSAQELARSNQELQQFAYVASHDLQEPLRAVTGYLGLIEERYRDVLDDKGRHHIAGAVEGAARMHTLINDLLDLSRVGTRARAFEPADLNTVLDAALSGLSTSLREAGARITHDPLPRLIVDAGQMTQLLQNLIGNALKFRSEAKPEIHVGARRVASAERRVPEVGAAPAAAERPGAVRHRALDVWLISVRDNGIGIEPQYFERIFQIFQRLHTRKQYPGTGIGLAICKKIVERHGGRIWVESQPDRGSTFCFTLPDNPV